MAGNRRNLGFPSNQIKGSDWSYFPGCGGSGAGGCKVPAAFSYVYWSIKVNPFSMHNSKLVLHNDAFVPHLDSPTGACTHNEGAATDFDVLLMYEEPIAGLDPSLATGIIPIPAGTTLPYDLEFDAVNIPQPDHPDYERKIWVVLDLKQVGLMIRDIPQITEVMQTVKLNWEGQP